MADGFDRYDQEMRQEGGGGSFVIGLLTGTVLGAGLGMLFAPKAGAELRSKLSEQAGNVANTASEGYRRASESAGQWAERGREIYNKASEAVAKGADEAQQFARDSATTFTTGSSSSGASSSGSDSMGSGSRNIGGPGSMPRRS
jgi:gas vesicle protein